MISAVYSLSAVGYNLRDIVWVACGNRPVSQILECIRQISHNAPFCNWNVHTFAHFCYKMNHHGKWDWGIMGFVKWVNPIIVWGSLSTGGTAKSSSAKWLLRLALEYYSSVMKMKNLIDWNTSFSYLVIITIWYTLITLVPEKCSQIYWFAPSKHSPSLVLWLCKTMIFGAFIRLGHDWSVYLNALNTVQWQW